MKTRTVVDTTGSSVISEAIPLDEGYVGDGRQMPPDRVIYARSPGGTFTTAVPLMWGIDKNHMEPLVIDGEAVTVTPGGDPVSLKYSACYIGCNLTGITSTDLIVEINI